MSAFKPAPRHVPYLDDEGRPLLDDQGNRVEMVVTDALPPVGIATVRNTVRLLDIECPRGHLVAVVKSPGLDEFRLLVLVATETGAMPALFVESSGLIPAVSQLLPDGTWTSSALGEPALTGYLNCYQCPHLYVLAFEGVAERLARTGRKKVLTLVRD